MTCNSIQLNQSPLCSCVNHVHSAMLGQPYKCWHGAQLAQWLYHADPVLHDGSQHSTVHSGCRHQSPIYSTCRGQSAVNIAICARGEVIHFPQYRCDSFDFKFFNALNDLPYTGSYILHIYCTINKLAWLYLLIASAIYFDLVRDVYDSVPLFTHLAFLKKPFAYAVHFISVLCITE